MIPPRQTLDGLATLLGWATPRRFLPLHRHVDVPSTVTVTPIRSDTHSMGLGSAAFVKEIVVQAQASRAVGDGQRSPTSYG